MKLRIFDRLGVLLDPRFWRRNYPIDHDWSDWLDQNMDDLIVGDIVGGRICALKAPSDVNTHVLISTLSWPDMYGIGAWQLSHSRFITVAEFRRRTAIRLRKHVQALAKEAT